MKERKREAITRRKGGTMSMAPTAKSMAPAERTFLVGTHCHHV